MSPPASMEPVTYGKATRQNIFEKSISASSARYNQHIRHALGFRETGTPGKGMPIFASKNVDQLYHELDQMAQKLPKHSHEELKRAWIRRTYTKDVKRLVKIHGRKIWGDALEVRKLSANPKSQLLTAEDGSKAGDLFYKYERHRKFIALQLEHLLFMKAIAVYNNYYRPSALKATTKPRLVSMRNMHPRASDLRNESDGAMAVEHVLEEAKRTMRMDLAILLYRELCHEDEGSHARLRDAESMLAKSKHLDSIIHNLRRQGEDTLRTYLGASFEQDAQILDAWLSWRKGCWLLSEATGIHPFGGQPTPRFTVEQWKEMFGGGEKCRKIHQTLLSYGRLASSIRDGKDKTTSSTAKSLARVFAAMAESPMLEDSLPDHIIAHNELLSSWKLDFWL
ncbi:hypothetical protein P171DRAFT_521076 [Karstenula rhodostoma CBS 690.94]|uniref:Uncharacterized protein n=1 Tax=Karstenula rhodostoma CBS 690.94 TaxID=1392251 RepID=A0A9P4UCA2_9PLEO|nr:hypothetical protein P171DRAFT_521076 [Karstenula rhodostoma CBS 690.94]